MNGDTDEVCHLPGCPYCAIAVPKVLTPERIEELLRENAEHKEYLRNSMRGTFSAPLSNLRFR